MSDLELKIIVLAMAACLGYFLISTASQLHAANERLAAVEARMGRVESIDGRSSLQLVTEYPEDAFKRMKMENIKIETKP